MADDLSQGQVRDFFDRGAAGRRLVPDEHTVGGLGSQIKYVEAAALMAHESARDVLDIGCNRGSIETIFHDRNPEKALRTRVEGVDISERAIELARGLGLKNCRFQSYDGITLPFPAQSFDLVVLVEVIEHVPDKERLLSEIARVLRPSALVFITTPNPECWPLRCELALWGGLRMVFRRPPPGKDAFIALEDLKRLATSLGLTLTDTGSAFAWPHLFVYFQGWSILPPLPPSLLLSYQRFCLRSFARGRWPEWLARRVCWTTSTHFRRAGAGAP